MSEIEQTNLETELASPVEEKPTPEQTNVIVPQETVQTLPDTLNNVQQSETLLNVEQRKPFRSTIPQEKWDKLTAFHKNVIFWWDLVYVPGYCVEMRVINKESGAKSFGYYDNFKDFGNSVILCNGKGNCYTTINPVKLDLMARYPNKQYGNWKAINAKIAVSQCDSISATKEEDIAMERLFFLDCDPIRAADISSNDEERHNAEDCAEVFSRQLKNSNIDNVTAMSGNGAYVIIPVPERPFSEDVDKERKALLQYLITQNRYTETVDIDKAVFNRSRIFKVLGTLATKGANCPHLGRVHRESHFHELRIPTLQTDIYELFRALPKECATDQNKAVSANNSPQAAITAGNSKTDKDRARKYIQKMTPAASGQNGSGQTFKTAIVLVQDFALNEADAWELLSEYNLRCLPPWSEQELRHKLEDALKAIDPARLGCKSDKRKNSSPVNGQTGGRPAVNYTALARAFKTEMEASGKFFKEYRNQWYTYNNRHYEEIDRKDLTENHLVKYLQRNGIDPRENMLKEILICLPEWKVLSSLKQPCFVSSQLEATGWMVLKNKCINVMRLAERLNGKDWKDEDCFIEHTPDLFTTFGVDYDYDANATCPMFDKYLLEVQPEDPEKRNQLKMFLGLSLVPITSYNFALLLHGDGGCGKGVYCHVAKSLVGEKNVCKVPIEDMNTRFKTWRLATCLLNVVEDMEASAYGTANRYEGGFKSVTSGDEIDTERKGRDTSNAPAIARCLFAMNSLPIVYDKSNAVYDRFRLVSFEQRFRFATNDNIRLRYDIAEQELPGVLNLAIRALARLLQLKKFPENASGLEQKQRERIKNNPFITFAEQMLDITENETDYLERKASFDSYCCFMEEEHNKGILKRANFYEEMEKLGLKFKYVKMHGQAKEAWIGVRMKPIAVQEQQLGTEKDLFTSN